jgi:hypothetical protein
MRGHRLLTAVGLCVGLASGAVIASEPVELLPLLNQAVPVQPPPPPKAPTPPVPPAPPSTTPPGAAAAPTLAPVTNTTGAAPQSLASSGAGFTPYMMGDLPTTSYVRQLFFFSAPVTFTIPPVYATVVNNNRVIVPNSVAQLPPPTQQVLVAPAQTVTGQVTFPRVALFPQVGEAAVKIEEDESPRPTDRVFVSYNYFDNVLHPVPGVPSSNLNLETYGFELTFLGGDASIGLRMSSVQTTGDSEFAGGDFGDLTVITKYALINDRCTGNVLSVGLAVTAPTGPDAVLLDGSRFNPVLIQPYSGSIYNWNKLYVQSFSSLIIPTDSRESLVATGSVGVGYWLYRSCDPCSRISYVAPVIEGHSTWALTHRGYDQLLFGFPDTFDMLNGVHIGFGQRTNLAIGVVVPLSGPKLFDVEALAQLNWRF